MYSEEPCEVITFYAYTGGAGRSMALANVACQLARYCEPDRGVLMIDWDLESPGLHHYFRDKLRNWSGEDNATGKLDRQPGLLDLFLDLDAQVAKAAPEASNPDSVFAEQDPNQFVIPTDIPALSLLKAGRFDGYYFSAVSSFQWAALHDRAPWLIHSLFDYWKRRYRFVLIDSTSGVNDMSGLCAMMLPDKLVALFTPSRQSLEGVLDVARCAADYRENSNGAGPLAIFPLPSRVEATEPGLRHAWRFGGESQGYQARFESLFGELAPGNHHSLEAYFADIQIPYVPRYSYGNEIAVTANRPTGASALALAYDALAERLLRTTQPWDAFQSGADLNVIEFDGRMLPLAEVEALCLQRAGELAQGSDQRGAGKSLELLASIKERLGSPAQAEAHYLEAIALYRTLHDEDGLASAACGLARLERLMGHLEPARTYYLAASKIYRTRKANGALAATLAILGDLDAQVGETDAGLAHYREAVETYESNWDDAGVAGTLMSLGDLERRLGSPGLAQEHYRQASRLFHKERDTRGLRRALVSLADAQNRVGSLAQSEENYCQAVELYRSDLDRLRLAIALRSLADLRRTLKKVDLALEHYAEAIELFRQVDEQLALANALQSLAELETRAGRNGDAQLHYGEAMVLYRKEGNNLGVANTMRSLGDLQRRLGQFDRSRSNYEEALELYRAVTNNIGLANTLQSLGDLDKRLGKLKEAEQRYTQAIQIYRGEGASLGQANSLKSLGDVESDVGNLQVARGHYEQAIDLYRSGGRNLGLANAMQSLGDLERRQKLFKEATLHYSTARDLYRQENHMTGLAYTCSELARVAHALFDFVGSIQYLDEAIAAANDSNSPSVVEYVWDVQREIRSQPAAVGT